MSYDVPWEAVFNTLGFVSVYRQRATTPLDVNVPGSGVPPAPELLGYYPLEYFLPAEERQFYAFGVLRYGEQLTKTVEINRALPSQC